MTGLRSGARGDGCGGPPGLAQPVASPPRSALRHCLGRAAAWTPHPHDRRAGATIASQREASAGAPGVEARRLMTRMPVFRRVSRLAQERAPAGVGKGLAAGRGVGAPTVTNGRSGPHEACFTWNTATPSPGARPRAVNRMVVGCRRPGSAWSGGSDMGTADSCRPAPSARVSDLRRERGPATGRGGAAGSPKAHGSATAQRTWECHRAENIGAPPQQRHRGSNGRANWRARREDRPSTAPGATQSARATGEAYAGRSSNGWNGGRGRHRTARASTYTAGTV